MGAEIQLTVMMGVIHNKLHEIIFKSPTAVLYGQIRIRNEKIALTLHIVLVITSMKHI